MGDISWTLTWLTVQSIATCLLVIGVFFAFRQIMQTRKSTNAEIAMDLFRELRNEDTKNTLRLIYRLRPNEIKDQGSVEIYKIKGLLDKLDLLGVLVKQRIIDELLAIEEYGGGAILKCWYQLRTYIKNNRRKQGIYCKYVEDLAKRTVKYQLINAPREEWIHFWIETGSGKGEQILNLVNLLRHELIPSRFDFFIILFSRCIKKRMKHPYLLLHSLLKSLFKRRSSIILRFVFTV